jgi:hypothetical protein
MSKLSIHNQGPSLTSLTSSQPISLSDLKAKRSAMDRAPWAFNIPEPPAGSVDIRGAECRCDEADDTTDPPTAMVCPQHEHVAEWVTLPNAADIVATHTAADVLIEIVEAALEVERTLAAWLAAEDRPQQVARRDEYTTACARHRAALTKVTA